MNWFEKHKPKKNLNHNIYPQPEKVKPFSAKPPGHVVLHSKNPHPGNSKLLQSIKR